MMDLESAIKHCEEVVEKLEKRVKPYQCEATNKKLYEVNKKEWDNYLERAKEHRQLAAWLKELKQLREQMSHSEKPNKWIPISKEVPKENGYYLTTNMFGEVYCDYWREIKFDRTETVIAWMELPLPYKAGRKE